MVQRAWGGVEHPGPRSSGEQPCRRLRAQGAGLLWEEVVSSTFRRLSFYPGTRWNEDGTAGAPTFRSVRNAGAARPELAAFVRK